MNEIFIYRYKEALDRALLVYDYKVAEKGEILRQVRNPQFDARKVLWLEEKPTLPNQHAENSALTNGSGSVQFVSYQPDDIHLEANLSRPCFLLFLDTYFPGWTATVNGQLAPIYRADYNFRAVPLLEGKSSVHFKYQPQSLRNGLILCAFGIFAIGAAWGLSSRLPQIKSTGRG